VINLAHGSLFMIGAYLAYAIAGVTGSLWLALPAALIGGALFGAVLELTLFRRFREREHLDQVLLTFALILLFEEARSALLDNQFHSVTVPAALDFSVHVTRDFSYSAYRIAVLGVCLGIAALMFAGIVARVKLGAFVLASIVAGVAGHMAAMTDAFVNPELLGWHRSAEALLIVLLGGIGALHGPILGAFAYTLIGELASSITERQRLVEGLVILAAVLLLRRGLAGMRFWP
jgi:branched-subunit amino acid ABC-type transport system permease component